MLDNEVKNSASYVGRVETAALDSAPKTHSP